MYTSMRNHDQDPGIAVFDDIKEARIFQPNWLRKRFNPQIPKAGVHHSDELTAFCESVDYERDGFNDVFNRNSNGRLHSLSTIYKNGQVDYIYFDTLFRAGAGDYFPQTSKKAFLVSGLHQHYGRWSELFEWYGDYIRPAFGSEFGLRLVSRSEPDMRLHTDHKRYDKVACTPLGRQKPSTIVQSKDGNLIEFDLNGTVITKRGCVHTSPPTDSMRVIMSANPLEKDSFTGLVLGFGG